jgi:RNA polymerase sigma-70 factor (ECF subfamily)
MVSTTESHADLLAGVRDPHNAAAWNQFVRTYNPRVYRYCRRRGLQDADAADVTQDVLKALAKTMPRFSYDRRRGTFRSWLRKVVNSKLNNHFRRNYRRPRAAGELVNTADPSSQPVEDDADALYLVRRSRFHEAAREVRRQVQARTWEAFWQTSMCELPVRVVAERLGMSVRAVYIARCRVLSRIKRHIAADGSPNNRQTR